MASIFVPCQFEKGLHNWIIKYSYRGFVVTPQKYSNYYLYLQGQELKKVNVSLVIIMQNAFA